MAELLFLSNSYLKEFEATVLKAEGKLVVLDKTVFYPTGGGQPSDTGTIKTGKGSFRVLGAKKMDGEVFHEVDREGLAEGDKIKGIIEWERRYKLMRMHTAVHAFCGLFEREKGCLITGNQLGTEESRVDLDLEAFDREMVERIAEETNRKLAAGAEVKVYTIPREEALNIGNVSKLAAGLPDLKEFRIVDIVGIDTEADGGTHVSNTKEVGKIEIVRLENKGKGRRRIYLRLSPA